jgi:hypothetical protein
MKVKYVGESFGVGGLTNGKTYECKSVEETDIFGAALRIVDDELELQDYTDVLDWDPGYLYSATNPAPLDRSSPGGKWEIVEDDENGTLAKAIRESGTL